jgi:hypothetical protein
MRTHTSSGILGINSARLILSKNLPKTLRDVLEIFANIMENSEKCYVKLTNVIKNIENVVENITKITAVMMESTVYFDDARLAGLFSI